ncbi:hypothetical protein ACFVQ3_00525 [Oerskovia sp. NPDC057915]|uniref:hypothetical protein n=1 Tax=Oerskovia sp. NPDC057915 TaxID=3346280 RepID=UPI0036DEDE5F
MIRSEILQSLPDHAILNEPEFSRFHDRLDDIDTREAAFDARETARHAKHKRALTEWEERANSAAFDGSDLPAEPAPVWAPSPGRGAFNAARADVAREIADVWREHGERITAQHLDAARREHTARLDAHADAVATERATRDALDSAADRVTFWSSHARSMTPKPSGTTPHPDATHTANPSGPYRGDATWVRLAPR